MVSPERINDGFIEILEKAAPQIIFALHINHPKELDEDVIASLRRLRKLGIPLLNQTVLLKGVNDDLETLKALSLSLVEAGIMPYYLHQLDRVQGAAHFEVSEEKGLELIEKLRGELPGYAVPKYVRELAGESSKTPLIPNKKIFQHL